MISRCIRPLRKGMSCGVSSRSRTRAADEWSVIGQSMMATLSVLSGRITSELSILPGSYAEMGVRNSVTPPKSGYNKGTIRSDSRYLVVSKDVRRHRLISSDYITTLPCHRRGREFESRRPRHFYQALTPVEEFSRGHKK